MKPRFRVHIVAQKDGFLSELSSSAFVASLMGFVLAMLIAAAMLLLIFRPGYPVEIRLWEWNQTWIRAGGVWYISIFVFLATFWTFCTPKGVWSRSFAGFGAGFTVGTAAAVGLLSYCNQIPVFNSLLFGLRVSVIPGVMVCLLLLLFYMESRGILARG